MSEIFRTKKTETVIKTSQHYEVFDDAGPVSEWPRGVTRVGRDGMKPVYAYVRSGDVSRIKPGEAIVVAFKNGQIVPSGRGRIASVEEVKEARKNARCVSEREKP